jgi:hypothetical protein
LIYFRGIQGANLYDASVSFNIFYHKLNFLKRFLFFFPINVFYCNFSNRAKIWIRDFIMDLDKGPACTDPADLN